MLHRSDSSADHAFGLGGFSSKTAVSAFTHDIEGREGSRGAEGPSMVVRKASSSLLSKRSKKVYETKHDPFRAAHVGDVNLLRHLLDRDGGMNKTRWSGWSLLHRAAESGQTEICEVLLKEYGADVNVRSTRGWHTPLHLSLANGFLETSLLLISYGGDVSLTNKDKQTPIAYAAQRGYNLVAAELEHEMFQRQMREIAANARIQEEAVRNQLPVIAESASSNNTKETEHMASVVRDSVTLAEADE